MNNLKSPKEIKIMREGGRILAKIVGEVERKIKVGITTQELNEIAEKLIQERGGQPSFLNFEGYPAVLCTSLNEELVHAVPSQKILKKGDILSLDLGIYWRGYHSDMAVTVPIGKISKKAQELIFVTKEALKIGIKNSKIGNTIGDIGYTIQQYVESKGFNVVRELCGHGIGKKLHEEPQILNFGEKAKGIKVKEGMVFCIEPIVTAGDWKVVKTIDGFGYRTKDNSLSCHFEHEIAIVRGGPFVLTKN